MSKTALGKKRFLDEQQLFGWSHDRSGGAYHLLTLGTGVLGWQRGHDGRSLGPGPRDDLALAPAFS
jgi:hypothetical protein